MREAVLSVCVRLTRVPLNSQGAARSKELCAPFLFVLKAGKLPLARSLRPYSRKSLRYGLLACGSLVASVLVCS